MIWMLPLIVTVKDMFIVFRVDDDGEGETFTLYSLLSSWLVHISLHHHVLLTLC